MPEIEIGPETEHADHWAYDVSVFGGGKVHRYEVTLSFADHNLWGRGVHRPSRVVEAAFAFLLQREPADQILSKFDCAVIRRYFPEVDRELPGMIGRG
jgi:hypothetical protein